LTHITEIRNLFRKLGSLADGDLSYKEKERNGRCREIVEKITRDEYTLDWSQPKVFLVLPYLDLETMGFGQQW